MCVITYVCIYKGNKQITAKKHIIKCQYKHKHAYNHKHEQIYNNIIIKEN